MKTDWAIFFSLASSMAAIFYAALLAMKIKRQPAGSAKMRAIAGAIAEGAAAYLKRQNTVVAMVAVVLGLGLYFLLGGASALAFFVGAAASAAAGFLGMKVAVLANVRTAEAAKKDLASALKMAVNGGAVTGLLVAGLALLSVSGLFFLINQGTAADKINLLPLVALGFGGSLISVFARLGGGIYTKGADVGADMVGKAESGIPEDDPRNPAVIADLVGDNVGDQAGMAADLFETYVVTMVSAMLLGSLTMPEKMEALVMPLAVGGVAILASIAATFFIKVKRSAKRKLAPVMPALYQGLLAAVAMQALAFYFLADLFPSFEKRVLMPLLLIGLLLTAAMVVITEYFTAKKFPPVLKIARASKTGHGTNIIAGLSLSMKATFVPIVLIAVSILVAYWLGGLYGVGLSAVSMLSLTGIIVSLDAFGPITDNAGGIAEMTGLPAKVRRVTDALDSVGNTTKAVTKAYAIASAGLAALVLFAAYTAELSLGEKEFFSLFDPKVIAGLFIGASLPYLFASLAMESVGEAASAVVLEVRRQFKEIKGLRLGKAKPQYGRCVDIVTQTAIKQMVWPAILPVAFPIIVGLFLGPESLGGFLMGTIITGLFVAISMTTGGAAWDNAKKFIEEGNLGGQGSLAHLAAITGDTVGDPYKDTAGPAINPMIKVTNIVALLLAPFL